jgi:hypothetical protein
MALITALTRMEPEGGEAGQIIQGELSAQQLDSLLAVDPFRRGLAPAFSSRDVWPQFLFAAACLFFADIFVRRVTIGFEWLRAGWNWLKRKLWGAAEHDYESEKIGRLRSRKAAIAAEIDERRAATRFEPVVAADPHAPPEPLRTDTEALSAQPPRPPASHPLTPDAPAEESYTSRLLKAKKQAWKDDKS